MSSGEESDLESHLKEISLKGSTSFFGKVALKLIGLPTKMILARYLGSSALGIYSLANALVSSTSQFAKLGMNNAAIKFVPKYKDKKEELAGLIFSLLIIPFLISLAVAILGGIFTPQISGLFNKSGLVSPLRIFLIALPLLVLKRILIDILKGFKDINSTVYVKLVGSISNLFLIGLVAVSDLGLTGVISAYGIALSLTVLYGFQRLRGSFDFEFRKSSFNLYELFRYSLPMLLSGIMWMVTRRTDILMLGYFLTSSDVGIYTAVIPLSIFVAFPQQAMGEIFSPIISRLHEEESTSEIKQIYQTFTRWTYMIGIGILIPIFFYSEDIILLFFGEEFIRGVLVLKILAGFEFLNIAVGPTGYMLQMRNLQDYNFYTNAFSAILNVGFNLLMIPIYGIEGAALATGLSLTLNNFLELFLVYKKFKIQPFNRKFLRLILPLLFTSLTVFLIEISWILEIFAVISVYTALNFLLMSDNDKEIAFNLVRSWYSIY